MVEVPETDEGWYSLHDFRSIEWDDWRAERQFEQDRKSTRLNSSH